MTTASRDFKIATPQPKAKSELAKADRERRIEVGEVRRMRTRTLLLDAAMTVLGHEGGRLATVEEIIGKASVSRGSFYNHFDGREQFLEAVAYHLSHEFNTDLEASLGGDNDAAKRGATWIRQYLHRVRSDPEWGWALVNVSLNGSKLLGEETYMVAHNNIALGCKQKLWKVHDLDAAVDLAVGTVLAAAIRILHGPTKSSHPEETAYIILSSLGTPVDQIKHLIAMPLPEVGFSRLKSA